ncbi:MAG: cadherin domain-containing protein [Bacteroidota bacterium]
MLPSVLVLATSRNPSLFKSDSSTGTTALVLVDIEGDGDIDVLNEASQSGGYFPLIAKFLSNADITGFSLAEQTTTATINTSAATIFIEVNEAADVTSLVATSELSPSASISPGLVTVQDYTSPVDFVVTAEDGVTTKNWTVTVSQVPSNPTLSIFNISQESAEASWTVSNGAATSFELQLSTTNDFSSLVSGFDPLVISGATSTTLSGLTAGTTYYARIRGSNALGTLSGYSPISTILMIPATPVATLATNIVAESFTANWNAANGAASYTLEVSADNFSSTVFTTTTNETVANVMSGLSAGLTYEYRVTATNATGTSPESNEIQVTTNVPPSGLGLDSQSIDENADVGSLVGTFEITDPDDTNHTYAFVTGTGDIDNELFSIDGSNLVTNQVFNFEDESTYSVRVQATDARGATSVAQQFNITISDVNDAPTAVTLETSCCGPRGFDPIGTKVADLFATDEDGDAIVFDLVAGGDSFIVNNTTKALSTLVVFETEVDLVIPIQLRATDPDGANVTENFNVTISAFIDTERPIISPSPQNGNTFLSGGPERTLSVTVEDFRLSQVKFFSRLLTESEFMDEVLTEVDGSYTKTVQESDLGVAGFEYYFEATDEAGNVGFSDLRTLALAFPESGENAPRVESVTKFGRTIDSYQIISIPFAFNDPSAKRVDAIFNEYNSDQINREYRIIKWDPTSGESGALVNLDQASTIELGEGYFFISAKERAITIESANINLQDPFPLVLRQGWNLVGNPYNIDIDWNSVLTNNGAVGTVGALRVLDSENPETWPESNILKTLEGAFVFANQDITLNMSYTDASISFGGGRVAYGAPEAEWFLPITLEQNGDFRRGGIGMDNAASASLDMYDEPVLPKWLEYLEIAFLHEGEKFSRFNKDVIPREDTKIWEFEVSSSTNGTSVLRWDETILK